MAWFDSEEIPRPHERQHARAPRLEADGVPLAQQGAEQLPELRRTDEPPRRRWRERVKMASHGMAIRRLGYSLCGPGRSVTLRWWQWVSDGGVMGREAAPHCLDDAPAARRPGNHR